MLIGQAIYVILRTPRLPEPPGERQGGAGRGPALRLLIVGDSSAAGVGVDRQEDALSGHLVGSLARNYTVTWRLIAQTGLTTRKLTKVLETAPADAFDVAVTALGVNDVTRLRPAEKWVDETTALHAILTKRFSVRRIYATSVPPLGSFPALPGSLARFLGHKAEVLARALEQTTRTGSTVQIVQPDWGLDPETMASDGFHPGAALYARWGAELAGHIRADLTDQTGKASTL